MRFGKIAIAAAVAASSGFAFAGSADDIGKATDPSAAIQVYVAAPDRSSLETEHAYVRRMAEFGTPELAESQAKDVVARDPHDAVGWAALAETNAKRGQMPEAMAAMVNVNAPGAVTADDPIVLGAAGRLSAWYQNFGSGVTVDPTVKQKMDDLGKQLADKPAFADAVSKAREAYSKQGTQQQTAAAPSNAPPTQSALPVQQQVAQQPQQSVYQPGGGTPVQVNPGPNGGTPIAQAPPPQTVTSADVNVPQQREWVSGDSVYQGSAYQSAGVYSTPAYVSEPVYVPAPTYYYYSEPAYRSYYYGPDVYIYGGRDYGYRRYDRDWHGRDWDRGHVTVHEDFHGDGRGDSHGDPRGNSHGDGRGDTGSPRGGIPQGNSGGMRGPLPPSPRTVTPTPLPRGAIPAPRGDAGHGDPHNGDSHSSDSRGGDSRGGDSHGGDSHGGGDGKRH